MADQQQGKKVAALAYDYDKDPRWQEYWSNVLIPAHLASKPDVERHYKLKFYQRNIDSELHVEPLSSTSSTSSSLPSANSSHRRPVHSGVRSNDATSTARSGDASRSNSFRMDQQSIEFLENAWIVVIAAFAILPFTPRVLSDRSYRFTFLGTIVACGHSIYLQYGRPRSWNMQGIQTWLHSVVSGKDFLYVLYSLVFISTFMPIKFAMIPVTCQALILVARYLKRNFNNTQLYKKYLEKPCNWLETNNTTMRMLSANCEIGLGFLLLFLLLTPQKNLIQLLVYWQLLKLMYHAPTTASFHRTTWSKMGRIVNPLIHQYVPFLQSPLTFAQRWFHN